MNFKIKQGTENFGKKNRFYNHDKVAKINHPNMKRLHRPR